METADCRVKVERRGSKQEMLLRLFFNGRTHSINSFKTVQHLRKKSSHVDTTYLEDICFQIRHSSAPYIRIITYHTSVDKVATPTVGKQIMGIAQGLSISETSFSVHSKALPYSHMMPFKDLFKSRLRRHAALASQKKEVIQDN